MQSAKGRLRNIVDSFEKGLIRDSEFIKNKMCNVLRVFKGLREIVCERGRE